jgi:hypothetical protein
MPLFKFSIQRITYSNDRIYRVEANTPKEALEKAYEKACNDDWVAAGSEFNIDPVTDSTTPLEERCSVDVKLYFTEDGICLGGCANNWWLKDYSGDYYSSAIVTLPHLYNPVGKEVMEIAKDCKIF